MGFIFINDQNEQFLRDLFSLMHKVLSFLGVFFKNLAKFANLGKFVLRKPLPLM